MEPGQFTDQVANMSLRDWLAGQALTGCEITVRDDMNIGYFEPAHEIARRCYQIADAMLQARKQTKGK